MKSIKIIRLSRKTAHKKSLVKNLFLSVIRADMEKKTIHTTKSRAKLLKSFGNSLLNSLINRKSLNKIRFLNSFISDKNIISYILNTIIKNKNKGFNFISYNKMFIRKGDSSIQAEVNLLY
jgi:ribosomal protein L17